MVSLVAALDIDFAKMYAVKVENQLRKSAVLDEDILQKSRISFSTTFH